MDRVDKQDREEEEMDKLEMGESTVTNSGQLTAIGASLLPRRQPVLDVRNPTTLTIACYTVSSTHPWGWRIE